MKICPEHKKPFSDKGPNSKGNYWHVINYDKQEYCNKTPEEYAAIPDEEAPKQTVSEERVPVEESSPNGMLMCNAMNNAIQLVCASKIEVTEIGQYYKKILEAFETKGS